MSDRRKHNGVEGRRNSVKVFKTFEEILKERTRAIEKLHEYEMDESVGVISFIVHAVAIASVIWALVGKYAENSLLLWTGVVGTIIALTLGEKWIRTAKKKANERFKKDNLHLAKYIPS